GNQGKYFHFSAVTVAGLSYSVIDLNLRNGLGDVVPTQKNIIIQNHIYDKITAVQHQNRRDIWVIARRQLSNIYHAFLVTPLGVNTTPVSSQIGMLHHNTHFVPLGAFKAAPDGRTLVDEICSPFSSNQLTYYHIQLIEFDAVTGSMTDKGIIPDSTTFGLEFSPNGSLLYSSSRRLAPIDSDHLWQYDLSLPTTADMYANRRLVATRPVNVFGPHYGHMQVG